MKKTIFNIIKAALLINIISSCMALKNKRTEEQKVAAYYHQQLATLYTRMQSIEEQALHENLQQQSEILELMADSLLYWHPDSGLQLKPGKVQLRYKARGLNQHSYTQHILHRKQEESKYQQEKEQEISQQLAAKDVERKMGYKWLAILIIVALIGGWFLIRVLKKAINPF